MTQGRAVLFDLDSTLLDNSGTGDVIRDTCVELAECFASIEWKALLQANTESFAEIWAEVEPDWTIGKTDAKTVSRETWRRALLPSSARSPSR
ncbi:MAG: HAD family hydrolase [Gemmatimonadetes bacterium]|jgi:phosphoserine phosphatase|nr:HAD family hydrolase [Gemmatimonadota bacterium]MBT4612739.1 HAD family hydrolase [Gemmatimonadota bacterium]MBT5143356.1 HAD family hydrolase [Gemmatimonadota bacterium]MBT5586710.1 HAD family hydrolase [Gemmatimonadota bacterium]MBT5963465.1 HAD family hydrolase [Gemmatimonadota bacterium]